MSGPIIVELPDGREVEFPAGTSQDVMRQAIGRLTAPAAEPPPPSETASAPFSLGNLIGNFNESLATGAARYNPVSLLIDGVNNAPRLLNLLPGEQGMTAFSERPVGGGDALVDALVGYGLIGDNFTPQNTPERYADRIGTEIGATVGALMLPAARAGRMAQEGVRPAEMGMLDRAFTAPMMTAPGKTAAVEGAIATGAGGGAQFMSDQFYGDQTAETIGALIGGLGVGGAAMSAGNILNLGKSMMPGSTERVAREAAGRQIVEAASNPANLERAPDVATPGVKLSTAQATGDQGLAALERSRQGAENSGMFAQRGQENNQALQAATESIAPPGFGDDVTRRVLDEAEMQARREFDQMREQALAEARARIAAEAAAGESAAARIDQTRTQADPRVTREVSSRTAAERVTGPIMERFRAVRNRLYGEVDPDVPVPTDAATATAKGIVDEAGRAGAPPAEISRIARSEAPVGPDENAMLIAEVFGDQVPEEVAQITFGQAKDDLTVLGDAARAAEREGRFGDARKIRMVQDAVRADMEAAEGSSEALARANAYEREEYAPRFREGAASEVRRGTLPTNEYLSRVFADPNEADRFIRTAGDDAEAMSAARDYFLGELTSKGADSLTSVKIKAWQKRNEEVLGRFPEISKEVDGLRAGLAGGEKAKAEAMARLKAAETDLAKAEKLTPPNREAAIKIYSDEETARESIAAVLRGKSSRENVARIVNLTEGNAEARDGLKRGFVEFFKRQALGAGADAAGNSTFKPKAAQDFMRDYGDHMRIIFRDSPGHVDRMEQIVSDIRRVNELASTAPIARVGKSLERITLGGMRVPSIMSRIFAAESGRTSYRFVLSEGLGRMILNWKERTSGPLINSLLDQALLDPKLAKALAATYTKANDERAVKALDAMLTRASARSGRGVATSTEDDAAD